MSNSLTLKKLVHVVVAALAVMAAHTLGASAAPARSGAIAETTACQPGAVLIEGACITPATPFQKSLSARLKPGVSAAAESGCGPGFPPVDHLSNPNHCGLCYNVCDAGRCTNGICQLENTVTLIEASASAINLGQSITFTAKVFPQVGNLPNRGNVDFIDGSTTLGTRSVANGIATFTTTALAAGAHSVTAKFNPAPNSQYRASDPSSPVSVTVNDAADSTTTVSSSLNPSVFGQAVRFTATVAGTSGVPAGTVQFRDGATALGSSVTLSPFGAGQTIAAGAFHSCAVRPDRSVECWGDNTYNESSPPPMSDAVAVAAGIQHGCALSAAGGVTCWGSNPQGQLDVPAGISSSGAVAISSYGYNVCAVTAAGDVDCWGDNSYGQTTDEPNLTDAVGVAVGQSHVCALRAGGTIECWGLDGSGQVSGATGVSDAVAIAAGENHSCALLVDGSVTCWGDNFRG